MLVGQPLKFVRDRSVDLYKAEESQGGQELAAEGARHVGQNAVVDLRWKLTLHVCDERSEGFPRNIWGGWPFLFGVVLHFRPTSPRDDCVLALDKHQISP